MSVHHLSDPAPALAQMGRKAGNLHRLARAQVRVPAGFVIPPDANLAELAGDLAAHVERIGGFPVAVRSSGQLEDLDGMSFAGQYDTYLSRISY